MHDFAPSDIPNLVPRFLNPGSEQVIAHLVQTVPRLSVQDRKKWVSRLKKNPLEYVIEVKCKSDVFAKDVAVIIHSPEHGGFLRSPFLARVIAKGVPAIFGVGDQVFNEEELNKILELWDDDFKSNLLLFGCTEEPYLLLLGYDSFNNPLGFKICFELTSGVARFGIPMVYKGIPASEAKQED